MVAASNLLGAALSMRVTADTTGLAADLASKLTAAERTAIASAERTSAATGRIADDTSRKLQAATLRQTAAQESYNRLLREGETDTVRLARAQASLITSQRTVANEQARINAAAAPRRGISPLGLLGGVAGFAALTTASRTLRTGINEIKEAQTGLAQAEAGIRSTGGAANVTAPQIMELGKSIQAYSGYTDDSVVAAEDLLLTFPKVRNEVGEGSDIFNRATEATADLARRGFGDLSTNAKALGKALSDPIAGLTALRRSGITFTDAQREQIAGLVESNQLLEAQRIILDEVNREVGGSAEAYGVTLPGKLDRAHRSFEDLSESLVTSLEPAISGAADAATFLGKHDGLVKFGLAATAAIGTVVLAGKAVRTYQTTVDTLFSGGRTASRVAQNTAVAESYNLIAGAAGRAAVAESAAAGVPVGGAVLNDMAALRGTIGRRSLGNRLLRAGGLAAGGIFAGQAVSSVVPGRTGDVAGNVLTGVGTGAALGSFIPGVGTVAGGFVGGAVALGTSLGGTGTQVDEQQLAALATTDAGRAQLRKMRALWAAAPEGLGKGMLEKIDAALASGAQVQTQIKVEQARVDRSALRQSGRDYASGVDIFSRAARPGGERREALDALSSARASQTTAQHQAELAEQRLNSLRRSGEATALQLASAEESLRAAKERSASASASVKDAEKAVDDARLPTAKGLLETITSQERSSRADAKAVARLRAAGLGPATITRIVQEDAERPGTLARVADTITPKIAAAIQRKAAQLSRDGEIIKAITGGRNSWEKAGSDAAYAFVTGFQAEYAKTPRGLGGQRRRQGAAGRTGAYISDPDYGRKRQRALSGGGGVA